MTPAQREAVAAYWRRHARRRVAMSAPLASVCLFCGSNVGTRPAYADAAREFGRALAARGMTLVYGGGSVGLMEIAAQAALDAGGRVIGVITEQLMVREVGHSGTRRTPRRRHDARAQGADGEALRRIRRAARRLRHVRRAVRDGDVGPARHPREAAGRRQCRRLLRRLPGAARSRGGGRLAEARASRAAADARRRSTTALAALATWQPPPVPQWLRDAAPRP